MAEWCGWMGSILRVDLSSGKITEEPLSREVAHDFIGGRGLNSKILYDETGKDTDPLGPDNRLIIASGPVSGTLGLGTGRFTVSGKSPLTGILGDSSGGGHFGAEVKFSGHDHIIVQGRASKPVYIWVKDDKVEIRDAQHLWGKDTWETSKMLRDELGDRDIKSLTIGPAGENLVKFACPMTDEEAVPAETGMGCIMGSKNLKAVAVRGSRSVKVADPARYEETLNSWLEYLPKQPGTGSWRAIGSTGLIKRFNDMHALAIRNAQELHRDEEEIHDFLGETFVPKYITRHFACFSCPMPCQKQVLIHDGPLAGERGRRPEFGPLFSMCVHLDVFDFPFGLKVVNMLNQLGLDAQECGPAMAMVFECYQRGILTRKDTDGLRLEWGNKEAILELVNKIAYRDGFGDVVADGCAIAARRIGKGAEKYAYHIKGKSHPDRVTANMRSPLAFSVATRGWDHLRSAGAPRQQPPWDYSQETAEVVREGEHLNTMSDSMEVCKFLAGYGPTGTGVGWLGRFAEFLTALTGMEFTEEGLHQAAERIHAVESAYLIRNGMRREDDICPRHFYELPIQSGPHKGMVVDREKFEQLKDLWYDLRGADRKTGAPRRDTLEALGLKNVADDLEKAGVYSEGK